MPLSDLEQRARRMSNPERVAYLRSRRWTRIHAISAQLWESPDAVQRLTLAEALRAALNAEPIFDGHPAPLPNPVHQQPRQSFRDPNASRLTGVYRIYDASDKLIYVGIGHDPLKRIQIHASTRWGHKIATYAVDWYATREDAEAIERSLLAQEQPPYNTAGTDRRHKVYGELRARYLRKQDEYQQRRITATS